MATGNQNSAVIQQRCRVGPTRRIQDSTRQEVSGIIQVRVAYEPEKAHRSRQILQDSYSAIRGAAPARD